MIVKVAILGSGFGLYGYLPAVVEGCHERVLLPERYRTKLQSRADVAALESKIEWLANEYTALEKADAAILAVRPDDQLSYANTCLTLANIERILLEKPVAPTPELASDLLDRVSSRAAIVRIGYTFRYTGWGQALLRDIRSMPSDASLQISWLFQAHHYKTNARNWKRSVVRGGGVIRFFGIHLIALLAEMGYTTPLSSEVAGKADEAEEWRATFAGVGLPQMRIVVHSNSSLMRFSVESPALRHQSTGPFDDASPGRDFDPRVEGLASLCRDFLYSTHPQPSWYRASIELWAQIENGTKHASFD
ncbi:Gfo/Idh/MocA family oxidoreductase [Rhizobium sp.]|uniref:Gfo/Idh/MocA family oxidoreductase n=1 Tax=Rhizobium sp. TaxID=391 RepID=UPI003F815F8C